MAQMTPRLSALLEKALALSTQDRSLLINRLIESLDEEPAESGAEEAAASIRYAPESRRCSTASKSSKSSPKSFRMSDE
jgi:hypothetical protein